MIQYDASRQVFIIPESDISGGNFIGRFNKNGSYLYLDTSNLNKIKEACSKATFMYSGEITGILTKLLNELKDTTNSRETYESTKKILESIETINVKT